MAMFTNTHDLLKRVDDRVKAKPDQAAENSRKKLGASYNDTLSHNAPSSTYRFSYNGTPVKSAGKKVRGGQVVKHDVPQQKFSWSDKKHTSEIISFAEMYAYGQHVGKEQSWFEQLVAASKNPSSRFYNPYYGKTTTQTAAQTFFAENFGYDGPFDDNFFQQFQTLRSYETRSDVTGSITSPGKNGTVEQWGAYWYTQLLMDKDVQAAVDQEWGDLRSGAQKWYQDYQTLYGKAPTVEQFMESVDSSKYSNLAKIDASRNLGGVDSSAVVQLNLGTNYSRENLYGLYYALSQGKDISEDRDYFQDAVEFYAQPVSSAKPDGKYEWSNYEALDTESAQKYASDLRRNGEIAEYTALMDRLYRQDEHMDSVDAHSIFGGDYKDDAWFEKYGAILEPYLAHMRTPDGTVKAPSDSDDMIYHAAYEYYQALDRRADTDAVENQWKTRRGMIMDVLNEGEYESAEALKEAVEERLSMLGFTDEDGYKLLERHLDGDDSVKLCRPNFYSREAYERLFTLALDGLDVSDDAYGNLDFALTEIAHETVAGELSSPDVPLPAQATDSSKTPDAEESPAVAPVTGNLLHDTYIAYFGEDAYAKMQEYAHSGMDPNAMMINALSIAGIESPSSPVYTSDGFADADDPDDAPAFDAVTEEILDAQETKDAANDGLRRAQEREETANAVLAFAHSGIPISAKDVEKSGLVFLPEGLDDASKAALPSQLASLWASAQRGAHAAALGDGYTFEQAMAADPVLKMLGDAQGEAERITFADVGALALELLAAEVPEDGASLATGVLDAAVPEAATLAEVLIDLSLSVGTDDARTLLQRDFDAAVYASAVAEAKESGADARNAVAYALGKCGVYAQTLGALESATDADASDVAVRLCSQESMERLTQVFGGATTFADVVASLPESAGGLFPGLLAGMSSYADKPYQALTEDILHDIASGAITTEDVRAALAEDEPQVVRAAQSRSDEEIARDVIENHEPDVPQIPAERLQQIDSITQMKTRVVELDEQIAMLSAKIAENEEAERLTGGGREMEIANYDNLLSFGVITLDEYETKVAEIREQSANLQNVSLKSELSALTGERDQLQHDAWFLEREMRYSLIPKQPDFAEKTAVVDAGSMGKWNRNYAYINNIDGYQYSAGLSADMGGGYLPESVFQYMSDEERGTYNYIYATQGVDAADEYLEYARYFCSARQSAESEKRVRDIVNSGTFGTIGLNALSVPASLLSGVGALDTIIQKARSTISGEYRPLDMNSHAHSPGQMSSNVRDQTSQNIAGAWMIGGANGLDAGQLIYSTGMSAVDSLAAGFVGGGSNLGAVILGLSSAQSTMQQLYNDGANESQILAGGIAAGVFETLFEKVSLGAFYESAADLGVKGAKAVVIDILAQTGINASEEAATEIANIWFDYLNRGDESDYGKAVAELRASGYSESTAKQKALGQMAARVGESALSGGLIGAAFAGVAVVNRGLTRSAVADQVGLSLVEQNKQEQFIADSLSGKYGEKAKALAERIDNANLDVKQVGKTVFAAYDNAGLSLENSMREGVKDVLAALEYDGDANKVADEVVRQVRISPAPITPENRTESDAQWRSAQEKWAAGRSQSKLGGDAVSEAAQSALAKVSGKAIEADGLIADVIPATDGTQIDSAAKNPVEGGGKTISDASDDKSPTVDAEAVKTAPTGGIFAESDPSRNLDAMVRQVIDSSDGPSRLIAERVALRFAYGNGQIDEAKFHEVGKQIDEQLIAEMKKASEPVLGLESLSDNDAVEVDKVQRQILNEYPDDADAISTVGIAPAAEAISPATEKVRAYIVQAPEAVLRAADLAVVEQEVANGLAQDASIATIDDQIITQNRVVEAAREEIAAMDGQKAKFVQQYEDLLFAALDNGIDVNSPQMQQQIQNKLREITSVDTDMSQKVTEWQQAKTILDDLYDKREKQAVAIRAALMGEALEKAEDKRNARLEEKRAQAERFAEVTEEKGTEAAVEAFTVASEPLTDAEYKERTREYSEDTRDVYEPELSLQQKTGGMIEVGEAVFEKLFAQEKARNDGYVESGLFERRFGQSDYDLATPNQPNEDGGGSPGAADRLFGRNDPRWRLLAENDAYIMVEDKAATQEINAQYSDTGIYRERDSLKAEKNQTGKELTRLRASMNGAQVDLASAQGAYDDARAAYENYDTGADNQRALIAAQSKLRAVENYYEQLKADYDQASQYIDLINKRLAEIGASLEEQPPKILVFSKADSDADAYVEIERSAKEAGKAAAAAAVDEIRRDGGDPMPAKFPELLNMRGLEGVTPLRKRAFIVQQAYNSAYDAVRESGISDLYENLKVRSFATSKAASEWADANGLLYKPSPPPNRFFVAERLLYQSEEDIEAAKDERRRAASFGEKIHEKPEYAHVVDGMQIADHDGEFALLVKADADNAPLFRKGAQTLDGAIREIEKIHNAITRARENRSPAWINPQDKQTAAAAARESGDWSGYLKEAGRISYCVWDAEEGKWQWHQLGARDADGVRNYVDLKTLMESGKIAVRYFDKDGRSVDFQLARDYRAGDASPNPESNAAGRILHARLIEARNVLIKGALTLEDAKAAMTRYLDAYRLNNEKCILDMLNDYKLGRVKRAQAVAYANEIARLQEENAVIMAVADHVGALRERPVAPAAEPLLHRMNRELAEGTPAAEIYEQGGGELLKDVRQELSETTAAHNRIMNDAEMLFQQRDALLTVLAERGKALRESAEAMEDAGISEDSASAWAEEHSKAQEQEENERLAQLEQERNERNARLAQTDSDNVAYELGQLEEIDEADLVSYRRSLNELRNLGADVSEGVAILNGMVFKTALSMDFAERMNLFEAMKRQAVEDGDAQTAEYFDMRFEEGLREAGASEENAADPNRIKAEVERAPGAYETKQNAAEALKGGSVADDLRGAALAYDISELEHDYRGDVDLSQLSSELADMYNRRNDLQDEIDSLAEQKAAIDVRIKAETDEHVKRDLFNARGALSKKVWALVKQRDALKDNCRKLSAEVVQNAFVRNALERGNILKFDGDSPPDAETIKWFFQIGADVSTALRRGMAEGNMLRDGAATALTDGEIARLYARAVPDASLTQMRTVARAVREGVRHYEKLKLRLDLEIAALDFKSGRGEDALIAARQAIVDAYTAASGAKEHSSEWVYAQKQGSTYAAKLESKLDEAVDGMNLDALGREGFERISIRDSVESAIENGSRVADALYRQSGKGAKSVLSGNEGGRLPVQYMAGVVSILRDWGKKAKNPVKSIARWLSEPRTVVAKFAKGDGAGAALINSLYVDPALRAESEMQNSLARYRKRLTDAGLSKDNSAAVFELCDGTATQKSLQDGGMKSPDVDIAVKAAHEVRRVLNEIYDQYNAVMLRNGLTDRLLDYRQKYIPHILDVKGPFKGLKRALLSENRPTVVAGQTKDLKPRTKWNSRAQKRRGAQNYKVDAIAAMEQYFSDTLGGIYQTDNIVRLRQLSEAMALMDYTDDGGSNMDSTGQLYYFKEWVDGYANQLAGKKTSADYDAEALTSRRAFAVVEQLKMMRARALLCGNLRTAITNFVPLIQSMAVNPGRTLVGMGKTIASLSGGATEFTAFEARSEFLTAAFGSSRLDLGAFDKVINAGFLPFNVVDRFTKHSVMHMLYDQGVSKGYTPEVAMRRADRLAHQMMVSRNRAGSARAYTGPLTSTALQFTQEAVNYLDWATNTLRHLSKGAPEYLGRLVLLMLGNWIYNTLSNSEAAPDPIGAGLDVVKGLQAGDNPLETVAGGISDVVNPFNRLMSDGAGGIPVVGWGEDVWEAVASVSADGFTQDNVLMLLSVAAGITPFGNPALRGAQGVRDVEQGYSQTASGLIRYPLEDSAGNYISAAAFGSSFTGEGRAFYGVSLNPEKVLAADGKPLSESDSEQIKRMIEAGIEPMEAYRNVVADSQEDGLRQEGNRYARLGEKDKASELNEQAAALREETNVPSGMADWALDEIHEPYMQNAILLWQKSADDAMLPDGFGASSVMTDDGETVYYLSLDGTTLQLTQEENDALEAAYHKMYKTVMEHAYTRFDGDTAKIKNQLSKNRAQLIRNHVLSLREP